MSIFSIWPYFVLMVAAWLVLCAPVFRIADEPLRPDRRTATLDGLRGFLALSVFAAHLALTHRYIETGAWQPLPPGFHTLLAQAGVMLFFMITGFLFWGKLLDSRGRPDWTGLYIGRVFRIGPMYLLAVGLMLAIVAWRTDFTLREPAWAVAAAVLHWLALGLSPLQPDVNGYRGTGLVLAGVTWTIFVEWLFYGSLRLMAGAACGARPLRFAGGGLLLCLAVLAVASGAADTSITHPTPTLLVAVLATILAAFFSGMTAACLVRRATRPRLPDRAGSLLALTCLGALFLAFGDMIGPVQIILAVVFFTLVCDGATLFGLLSTRPARRMSAMSYSLYLMQGLALTLVFAVPPVRAFAMADPIQFWLVGGLCALLLLAVSAMTYRWVEQPGIALGRRLRSRLASPGRRGRMAALRSQ
ncbi:acyltransferase [Inquilinus sp. Marseille-Q2685]|uniref:acyltransferase family protein n=1 Tax=Inquilinus sp. Marseille-Q2685 TaxID=2866581 RepID=UPI001CE430AC|nr:acyltransferase [Inquilinus sp. Marseille-Q2685]